MTHPELTNKPQANAIVSGAYYPSGTTDDYSDPDPSADNAVAAAIALAEDPPSAFGSGMSFETAQAIAQLTLDDEGPPAMYKARASTFYFTFRFASATCYFKVWWQVETTQASGDVSTEDQEYLFTPYSDGGYCIPNNFNWFDTLTHNASDTYVIEPPVPDVLPTTGVSTTASVQIVNLRWSYVDGYEPASDDPAIQGFPP